LPQIHFVLQGDNGHLGITIGGRQGLHFKAKYLIKVFKATLALKFFFNIFYIILKIIQKVQFIALNATYLNVHEVVYEVEKDKLFIQM